MFKVMLIEHLNIDIDFGGLKYEIQHYTLELNFCTHLEV